MVDEQVASAVHELLPLEQDKVSFLIDMVTKCLSLYNK